MHVERHVIEVTTAADGSATAYSPVVTGRISAIHYVKNDFADGVDFTVTSEATGQQVWVETNVNASAIRAPRQPVHTQAGAAISYAATFAVHEPISVAKDRIKFVLAAGGDTKRGTFHVVIE